MSELLTSLKKSPYKLELALALVLSFVTMLFFCYKDAVCLTVWGTNLLDVIAQGRFTDYYYYCIENLHDLPIKAPGGIFLGKIPLAIWCLPIWIAQYFFGVEIRDSVICMIWARLFYVALLVVILMV